MTSDGLRSAEFKRCLAEITWLISQSDQRTTWTIDRLRQRVFPALLLKQVRIFWQKETPVAALTWAMLEKSTTAPFDDEVVADLAFWRSGKSLAIVDCFSPYRDEAAIIGIFFNSAQGEERLGRVSEV